MARLLPARRLRAATIFDLEDGYARGRGLRGQHPRPLGPLAYNVRGRMRGGVLDPYDPEPVLRIRRNPSGYDLCFGEAEIPDGERRWLVAGDYAVRIVSRTRFYEPVERRDIAFPRPDAPYPITLEPAANYPFPLETMPGLRGPTLLRGSYREIDGSGIEGATVRVPNVSSTSRTGADGQWVLTFRDDHPGGPVDVEFLRNGGPAEQATNVLVPGGRTTSLRETIVRGWTLDASGAPLADVIVVVGGYQPVRSEADGSWQAHLGVAQADAALDITASLPGGRSATQPAFAVTARQSNHVPAFRL